MALDPANADAWNNRGLILRRLRPCMKRRWQVIDRALALKPDYAEARNNRGLALQRWGGTGRWRNSTACCAEKPGHAGAYVNRASVLRAMGDVDQALDSYNRALGIHPDMPEALASRANLSVDAQERCGGRDRRSDQELVALKPDHPYARAICLHLKMHAGDWRGFDKERAALDQGVRAGKRVVEPYVYQGLSSSPADLLACAKIYAADEYPARSVAPKRGAQAGQASASAISAANSAPRPPCIWRPACSSGMTASASKSLAFDNGRDDQSPMRRRVNIGLRPVHSHPVLLGPRRRANDRGARRSTYWSISTAISARAHGRVRPSARADPGQLSGLSRHPGRAPIWITSSPTAMVIPEGEERFFTEKVVWLPDSYQVNDSQRAPIPCRSRARRMACRTALSSSAISTSATRSRPRCSPPGCGILRAVPGSVLWLLESNALFAANLRAEAAKAGRGPRAPGLRAASWSTEAHLARLTLADLFLDTLPYNAHTTASDALWAGLPLLTCRGEAFAGRVAASLLHAVGLPELVAKNWHEYEAMAVRLSRDRRLLASYRDHLNRNRATLPLFDTARTTRHIEAAYEEMMARWSDGEKPASFMVRQEDT